MAVAKTEGCGSVYMQDIVCGGGHSGMPSCVAAPAAGRADWCGSSPTSTDGGQPARYRSREEFGSPRPEQAHRRQVQLPRGLCQWRQIVIEFVKTSRQLADVLTKPLGRLRFTELKKMIGIVEVLGLAAELGEEL